MNSLIPILLNQVFSFAFGLWGLKLVSAHVSPETLGRYGLFLTMTQLGNLLTHSGLINHTSRYC